MTDPKSEPSELLPCPFCGHPTARKSVKHSSLYSEDLDREHYAIMCSAASNSGKRGKGCGATSGFFPSKEEAAQAWQARAALTPAPAQPEPDYVSRVTECEACLTEDACRIRGQCGHYLREKEAQPEPPTAAGVEPVAWVSEHPRSDPKRVLGFEPEPEGVSIFGDRWTNTPLYTTPPTLTDDQCDAIWLTVTGWVLRGQVELDGARARIRAAAAGAG